MENNEPGAAERVAAYVVRRTEHHRHDQIDGYNGNTPLLVSDLRDLLAGNAHNELFIEQLRARANGLESMLTVAINERNALLEENARLKSAIENALILRHMTNSMDGAIVDLMRAITSTAPLGRIVEAQPATATVQIQAPEGKKP